MIDMTAIQIENLPFVPYDNLRALPQESIIYFVVGFVVGQDNSVLYIGQSMNLNKRWIGGHRQLRALRAQSFQRVHWLVLAKDELVGAEAAAIARFSPLLNVHEPHVGDLQTELEAVFYKFYGNLEGQYIEQQKRS